MVRAKKPKPQTTLVEPPPRWLLSIGADILERLHLSAMANGRRLIEEIEFRLNRDLEREALGPRRSIPIRRKNRKGGT